MQSRLDPNALFARAQQAFAAGRPDAARADLLAVQRLAAPHPAILHLLALVEEARGAAAEAEAAFDRVVVSRQLPEEIEEARVTVANGTVHLPELLADLFGVSRSEARRMLTQGAVKLDGEAVDGAALDLPAAALDGRVLQLGKRRFRRLRVA